MPESNTASAGRSLAGRLKSVSDLLRIDEVRAPPDLKARFGVASHRARGILLEAVTKLDVERGKWDEPVTSRAAAEYK